MERILLVDDEPSIRLFYADVLADNGFDVLEAESGDEALELIQTNPLDIVALDIKLGSQNGLDVLQRITRSKPELPVVLLTAYLSFQDDYTSWLADSYVLKSSDPTEFLREVRRIVKQPRKQQASGTRHHPARASLAQFASPGGQN